MVDPSDGQAVFAHTSQCTGTLDRVQVGDKSHALFAPLVDIGYPPCGLEERIDARNVVAHIVDQLAVARSTGAMEFAHQVRVIGWGIVGPEIAPEFALLTVLIDHRIPTHPVVR